ncbi:MAG: hypothetical protein KF819_02045 [Labilithrix sp.]|nr:hypothetical protein [Labilithrix sp.]
MRSPRTIAFALVTALSAMSILAGAQTKKPAAPVVTKKPPVKPAGAGTAKPLVPDDDVKDAGPLASKEERSQPASSTKDAGAGGAVLESKTLDGGSRVFRFGEVEVEGRLKSPQIVYFLRRVRAEFAAGDLGHRSFSRELSETRNEPGF